MPIYLVTMSLQATGHDYKPLWQAMENAEGQRLMDTTWLINVIDDVEDVTRAILSHLGATDRLFLVEFRPSIPWSGTRLDDETKEWLATRISGIRVGLDVPAQSIAPAVLVDPEAILHTEKKRKRGGKKKSRKSGNEK